MNFVNSEKRKKRSEKKQKITKQIRENFNSVARYIYNVSLCLTQTLEAEDQQQAAHLGGRDVTLATCEMPQRIDNLRLS